MYRHAFGVPKVSHNQVNSGNQALLIQAGLGRLDHAWVLQSQLALAQDYT